MPRALFVCALLALLPSLCPAADPPSETVVKMTVDAAPAPKPALRYHLLPDLREMNPGNPIQAYTKCFAEQQNFWYDRKAVEDREKWQTAPLNELPLKEINESYGGGSYGGAGLRQADYAARLDTPDWQILIQARKEGYRLLLPDLQPLRNLASALKVRFRAEVAARRFDDALVTAATMLALSRHLGEHPTLIGNLVGLAVSGLAMGPLDEMIQQPGCPNLYWALTNLPTPLVDLRKGVEGERLLDDFFAGLDDREPMTDAQLQKVVDRLRQIIDDVTLKYGLAKDAGGAPDPNKERGDPKEELGAALAARAKDDAHVRAARGRLAEAGLPKDRLEKFPALQVVLLDERLAFESARDDVVKGVILPYWQFESVQPAQGKDGKTLLTPLVPSVLKIRRAQARLDQRLALLRHVEALRMYAAESGKLPAKLDDVKVPLPADPFTGKPFAYKLDGQTAVLQGSAPKGEEKNASYNVRYEVTLRK